MKYISQSQINLYRKCPYAYYLRYALKKESIFWNPTLFEVGSRVHDAIDVYYKNHYVSDATEEEVLNKVYGALRREWDVTLPAELLKKAYTCLCNFSSFEAHNNSKGRTKPFNECKIYVDDMMGIIDYVDLNSKTLVDFKTNGRAGLGYSYKMQAVMYRMLAKSKFNIDVDYFKFFFLYPNEWRTVKFGDGTTEVAEEMIDYKNKIKESWETGVFPKAPRTKSCGSCEYKFYCDGVE